MKSSTDFQEMRNRAAKSAVPFLGIYPKEVKSVLCLERNLHFHIHCSTVQNIQDMGIASTSINRRIERENTDYIQKHFDMFVGN